MIKYYAPSAEVVENSLFGVSKGPEKQRKICKGKRSNQLLSEDAKTTELPTPDF